MCNEIYRTIKESEYIPFFLHKMKSWNWWAVSKQETYSRFIDNFMRYNKIFVLRIPDLAVPLHRGILLKNPAICDCKERPVISVMAEEMRNMKSENKRNHFSADT